MLPIEKLYRTVTRKRFFVILSIDDESDHERL